MSSFVISKIEYIKAAGLMYGIEESNRYPHDWFLRNAYDNFVMCYEANEKSVAEQYGEDYTINTFEYKETFEFYRRKGRHLIAKGYRNELKKMMKQFFDSSLYQIENEEMRMKCCAWYWMCLDKFDKFEIDDDVSCWGRINIDNL